MTANSSHSPPTVVISEQHLFTPYLMVGAHQYAKVFLQHGWKVAFISASFHIAHLFKRSSFIPQEQIQLWKSRGKIIEPNLINICFSHLLPRRWRYKPLLKRVAQALYIPDPRSVLGSFGISNADLLWLNGNEDWLYRFAIPHKKLVVRIVDNYAGFNAGYDNFHPLLLETFKACHGVFTCSHAVRQIYHQRHHDIQVIPNGVDIKHFSSPAAVEPACLRGIPHPRICYVGYIGNWFDLDLLMSLARRKPDWHFIVAGPWHDENLRKSPYPSNIHILGPIPYKEVPTLFGFCDLGWVPFKSSELVKGVSPIKIYEYLSAGLPVVSLRWPELEKENLPIALAEGESEFLSKIDEGLQMSSNERTMLKEHVRICSWESRLKTLLEHAGISLQDSFD